MIVILGGGLSGSLLAYRLAQLLGPDSFLLIEAKNHLCGNHTWSFHSTDISSNTLSWLQPLIRKSWEKQDVRFKGYSRTFSNTYHSIASSQLENQVRSQIGDRLILNQRIVSIQPQSVTLDSGRTIDAKVIIDARGMPPQLTGPCGFQKFVGLELELKNPHLLTHPVIMDTFCQQKEGYRFFYLLPWDETSILIEDTRYSSNPELDIDDFEKEILDYCQHRKWEIKNIIRREIGSLPIPLVAQDFNNSSKSIIPIGVRGGYFHSTTGYSLPYAIRVIEVLATEISENPEWTIVTLQSKLKQIQTTLRTQSRFLAMLNRMLFLASNPSERWKVFERFYKLKEDLIFRFYRGELKFSDRIRILIGKPPVPIFPALVHALNLTPQERLKR